MATSDQTRGSVLKRTFVEIARHEMGKIVEFVILGLKKAVVPVTLPSCLVPKRLNKVSFTNIPMQFHCFLSNSLFWTMKNCKINK
jgi:hypothetical protein